MAVRPGGPWAMPMWPGALQTRGRPSAADASQCRGPLPKKYGRAGRRETGPPGPGHSKPAPPPHGSRGDPTLRGAWASGTTPSAACMYVCANLLARARSASSSVIPVTQARAAACGSYAEVECRPSALSVHQYAAKLRCQEKLAWCLDLRLFIPIHKGQCEASKSPTQWDISQQVQEFHSYDEHHRDSAVMLNTTQ